MSKMHLGCVSLLSLLPVVAAGCEAADPLASSMAEIVGGKPVDIRDYPWQVALRSGSFQFCGGSIINESWILSAAHCVDGNSGNIQILAGTAKLSQASLGQIRSVEQIVVYPGYQDVDQGKDASLLKLDTPLDLSGDKVKAIPILTAADRTAGLTDEGVTSWVSGWGTLSAGGSSPDALQAVDVPIIGNAKADEMYDDVALTDDQLAAGVLSTGGKDSCQGDSGGPLIVKDADGNPKLAGIVSWGYGCADAKYPGMYGRVSSFEGWINDVLDGGAEPPEPEALSNGTAVSELGASQSTWTTYKIDVPAGATNLVIKISGGTGDGDLYTRFGAIPTTAKWDCRPYTGTNDETCTVAAPQAGTYYASIYAYKAFASVNLLATFTAPATE